MKLDQHAGTWKWGILCLVFLSPFFFLTYGFSNQYAHNLKHVPSLYFEWEKIIPFCPWSILLYWSIALFYGLSLLLCWNTFELKQHALRLFTAQIICIACFILFPLKFAFELPERSDFFTIWFDALIGFEKPFNQAPSLHIALLVILWDFYRRHVSGYWKSVVDIFAMFIGVSALTTWQHHFINIPTGILVGGLCLWLFPVSVKSPFRKDTYQYLTPKHCKLAAYYWIGAIIFAGIAWIFKGTWLWLFYPAISLCFVGFAYILVRPHFFQKQADGKLTSASRILFAPYMLLAWIHSRLWTQKHPEDSKIIQIDDKTIYLGRIPMASQASQYDALFDCCAELTVSHEQFYQYYLSLDLIPLQANQLYEAVKQFDQLWDSISMQMEPQKLFIFCALGYSRSTAVLCAWLIGKEHADSVETAIAMVKESRPWIKLSPEQIKQLHLFVLKLKGLSP